MTDVTKIDMGSMNPAEGVLTAASICVERGLRPCKVRISPSDYRNVELSIGYLHEYIDEESRSYLVLRLPERCLVYTDVKLPRGQAFVECREPDVSVEVLLAY